MPQENHTLATLPRLHWTLLAVALAVLMALGLLSLAQNAEADTLTVDDDGPADYDSVQDAIDNASAKDTIFIYNGTYRETLEIDKSLNLIGEDREETVIEFNGTCYFPLGTIYVNSNNISISSLNITLGCSGISIGNAYNISVTESTFYSNGNGIYLFDSYNVSVQNNYFNNNTYWSLTITSSTDTFIEDNYITQKVDDIKGGGIAIGNSQNLTLINNTVERLTFGIIIQQSISLTLRNNTVLNSDYLFSVAGETPSHFYHDIDISNTLDGKPIGYFYNLNNITIEDSLEYGYLAVINGTNITIRNLNLSGNGEGLLMVSVDKSRIENVTLWGNVKGLLSINLTNTTIVNLNLTDNYEVSKMYGSSKNILSESIINDDNGLELLEGSNYNYLFNNTFYANQVSLKIENTIGNRVEHNRLETLARQSVTISYSTLTQLKNNTFVKSAGSNDISISNSDNSTIINNTFIGPKGSFWLYSVENITVRDNGWGGNDSTPLRLTFNRASNNLIIHNNLSGNDDYGVELKRSDNNFFVDNRILDNGKSDLYLKISENNTFLNTTFQTAEFNTRYPSSFQVQWRLRVAVTNESGEPLTGAQVWVADNDNGSREYQLVTDSEGLTPWVVVSDYYRDSDSTVSYNPYNLSGVWEGLANSTLVNITSSRTVTLVLSSDSEPPTARVAPLPPFTAAAAFPVAWSGEDDGSGVANYTLFISPDGSDWSVWLANTTAASAVWSNTSDGDRAYFYALATDNAGNQGPLPGEGDSQAVTTVDTTPPTAAVEGLPPFTAAAVFEVSWSGSDRASGLASFTLFTSPDGTNWSVWLANTTAASALWANTSDGDRAYFYALATDKAGNRGPLPGEGDAQAVTLVDTTPPTATVAPLLAFTTSAAFEVSWSGSDTASGLASFTLFTSPDGADWSVWLADTAAASANWTNTTEGETVYFYALATDNAGNRGPLPGEGDAQAETLIDTTPPSAPQFSPSGSVAEASPTLTVTFAEPVRLLSFTLDGANISTTTQDNRTFSHTPEVVLAEGLHTIEVMATDPAGNPLAAPAGGTFTIAFPFIDTTPPTITFELPERTTQRRPVLKVTFDEPVTILAATLDWANVTADLVDSGDGMGFIYTPTFDLTVGTHTFYVEVTDEAGNEAEATGTFNVEKKDEKDASGPGLTTALAAVAVVVVISLVLKAFRRGRGRQ